MTKRTWQRKPPKKATTTPKVSDEIKATILADASSVVASLKKRFCKKPAKSIFNWPEDIFVRWHRDCLYFVVIMRTPHGIPPTFESHIARLEHAGNGKFNVAVPMRRGWMTTHCDLSAENCFETVPEIVYL